MILNKFLNKKYISFLPINWINNNIDHINSFIVENDYNYMNTITYGFIFYNILLKPWYYRKDKSLIKSESLRSKLKSNAMTYLDIFRDTHNLGVRKLFYYYVHFFNINYILYFGYLNSFNYINTPFLWINDMSQTDNMLILPILITYMIYKRYNNKYKVYYIMPVFLLSYTLPSSCNLLIFLNLFLL